MPSSSPPLSGSDEKYRGRQADALTDDGAGEGSSLLLPMRHDDDDEPPLRYDKAATPDRDRTAALVAAAMSMISFICAEAGGRSFVIL